MSNTVTTLAEQAATAIHELALLTRPAITSLDVHDLYTATGALAELAARLPQTLTQLAAYLNTADVTVSDGQLTGETHPATEHARTCLQHATAAAAHLATALDAAHQTLGDPTETTATKTGGQFSTGDKGSIFDRR